MIQHTIDSIIDLLYAIEKRQAAYAKVDAAIKEHIQDASYGFSSIDDYIETAIFAFISKIMGDDMASYYFYECKSMSDGGCVSTSVPGTQTKHYSMRNLEDLRKYWYDEYVKDRNTTEGDEND